MNDRKNLRLVDGSPKHRESLAAQHAFDVYLDLHENRSLRAVHEKLRQEFGKASVRKAPTLRTVEHWSAWFSWQERTAAHDKELNRRNEERKIRYKLKDLEEREAQRLEIASMTKLIYRNYITKTRTDKDGNEILDEE